MEAVGLLRSPVSVPYLEIPSLFLPLVSAHPSHFTFHSAMTTTVGDATSTPPMHVDLDTLIPLAVRATRSSGGTGLVVCRDLGLLITSNFWDCCLDVFALPRACSVAGVNLDLLYSLGRFKGEEGGAKMAFKFNGGDTPSGYLAFVGCTTSRLLLVSDAGSEAVHVVDVVGRKHVGYVAAPGTIDGPKQIATRGSLVAVNVRPSSTGLPYTGEYKVVLFEGSGVSWMKVREVQNLGCKRGCADERLYDSTGLRFTRDGTGLVVANNGSASVSILRVQDWTFERHVVAHPMLSMTFKRFVDVEECEGGWLIAYATRNADHCAVTFVDDEGVRRATMGQLGREIGEFTGLDGMTLVPGLGLVTREFWNNGRVQVFATPDVVAMGAMSHMRVAWMVAVARGVASRAAKAATAATREGSMNKRRPGCRS